MIEVPPGLKRSELSLSAFVFHRATKAAAYRPEEIDRYFGPLRTGFELTFERVVAPSPLVLEVAGLLERWTVEAG